MTVTAVQMAGAFLSALCALTLIGCGSSGDSSGGEGFTPVTVASVGEFQGELATLAERQFARVPLREGVDVNLPIVLDGADLDAINDDQWLSIESANREGWPVVLLQPTREQIETLIANLDLELEAPEDVEGLDAIGYQHTDVGDIEAVFEYLDTDTDPDRDVRVAAIGDWVVERQFPASDPPPDSASAGQAGGTAPELETLLGALTRQVSWSVDDATHVVVVEAWAVHQYEPPTDYYLFKLNTNSSGGNYTTSAFARTRRDNTIIRELRRSGSAARSICAAAADLTSCVRERYLKRFEVTLFALGPEVGALQLVRTSPSTDRQSNSYTISTNFSIGGSASAGFSKEKGAKGSVGVSAGLSINRTRTITIPDATIVADHFRINTSSASWRLEMPDPAVEDREKPFKPRRLLQEPARIQRFTHTSEQVAIYRVPEEARATLNDKLTMHLRIQAGEATSVLDWVHNAFNPAAPGCGGGGGNCRPEVIDHQLRTGGATLTFPLADDTTAPVRPQLSSLSRTSGRTDDRISLRGSGLNRATDVFFGPRTRAEVWEAESDSEIKVFVPEGIAPGTTVGVFVQSGDFLSNDLPFTFN